MLQRLVDDAVHAVGLNFVRAEPDTPRVWGEEDEEGGPGANTYVSAPTCMCPPVSQLTLQLTLVNLVNLNMQN